MGVTKNEDPDPSVLNINLQTANNDHTFVPHHNHKTLFLRPNHSKYVTHMLQYLFKQTNHWTHRFGNKSHRILNYLR